MSNEINVPIQEEVDNKKVLEDSAEKLAVIASKLSEIFKTGFDAGFIGDKSKALLEAYKQDAIDYIDRQIDHIVTAKDSDGILETIAEISAALNNDANAFATLVNKISAAKSEAITSANTYTDGKTNLIPFSRGGLGSTSHAGAINALAQLNAGTPSSVQIIYDSIEKTGVITENCETREFIKKMNRNAGNIEFPHSEYLFTSTGTEECIHLTDMPEAFGYVTLSWNGLYRVRGMFYSSHNAAVYVYTYRKDWEGTAYEVTFDSATGKYTELPSVFMVNSTSAGVSANLSLYKVDGALTDTGRQVYKFGENEVTASTRYYCMHEDEICPINYPDYGWRHVGYRGGDILGGLTFVSNTRDCGGYIERVVADTPKDCGLVFASTGDTENKGTAEKSGIKISHSPEAATTDRLRFFASIKQYDKDGNLITDTNGNPVLKLAWYRLYGEHNIAFDSITSDNDKEAGENVTHITQPRYVSSAVKRDSYGRSSIQDPIAPKHIANKKYVDKYDAETLKAAETYADDAVTNALSALSLSSEVTTAEGTNTVTLTPANGTPTSFEISEAKKAYQDKDGNDITEEYVGKPTSVSYRITHLSYDERKTINKNTFYYVKIRLVDDVIDAGILYTGDGANGGTNVVWSMDNNYKARVAISLNTNDMCVAHFLVSAGTIDADDVEAWLYPMNKGGSLK